MEKIICNNLEASYFVRNEKKSLFKNLSFQVECGEFVCLCGPNGSGKSSLLSLIAGLAPSSLKVTGGTIFPDAKKLPRRQAACLLAYLQQSESCAWDFPVLDYVVQGRYAHSQGGNYSTEDYQLARDSLAVLEISSLEKRTVHTLSGGEFQKVRIARALTQAPRFLLLDEPAASLDFVYEPRLMKLLRDLAHQQKLGILLSVHDVNLAARFADKMIMLTSGESGALFGSPAQIMTAENLEKIYGVKFECKEKSFFQSSL
ncbi:MAG: ABC transporter ATP-binding protein [Treponema sp.]|nr:ABC transporter ATP-binding protein [Treponema sp.]